MQLIKKNKVVMILKETIQALQERKNRRSMKYGTHIPSYFTVIYKITNDINISRNCRWTFVSILMSVPIIVVVILNVVLNYYKNKANMHLRDHIRKKALEKIKE